MLEEQSKDLIHLLNSTQHQKLWDLVLIILRRVHTLVSIKISHIGLFQKVQEILLTKTDGS